jgi:hypothetical protein
VSGSVESGFGRISGTGLGEFFPHGDGQEEILSGLGLIRLGKNGVDWYGWSRIKSCVSQKFTQSHFNPAQSR